MDVIPLRAAGTVVVVRDGDGRMSGMSSSSGATLEVLLLHKGHGPQFHAGHWVFPGGAADPADAAGLDPDDDRAIARRAAVREAREEAGLILDPTDLVPLSHWTTPEGANRRFATWFFLAQVRDTAALAIDGDEIIDSCWLTPTAALDRHHEGALVLPVPQYLSMLWMAEHADVASALARAAAADPIRYLGRLRTDDDGRMVFLYDSDVAYDGGPLDKPGARHRAVQDGLRWRYERT